MYFLRRVCSYLNVLHLMFSYGEDPPTDSICIHQLLIPIISLRCFLLTGGIFSPVW